jgi:hypothetical protein
MTGEEPLPSDRYTKETFSFASIAKLSAGLAGIGMVAGLIGAYPTWERFGWDGVKAEITAGVIVLVAMIASAVLVARRARRGASAAAFMFIYAGAVRAVLVAVVGGVGWKLLSLPGLILGVWLGVFYLVMLAGESAWMCGELKSASAHQAGQGQNSTGLK